MHGDAVKVFTKFYLYHLRRLIFFLQEIIQTAFEHGVNMFDTAEAYEKGKSELEM